MTSNEIVWIILAVFSLIIFFSLLKYIPRSRTEDLQKNEYALDLSEFNETEAFITIKALPITTEIEERQLSLISNKNVIARISESVPQISNKIAETITNSELGKKMIYEAIIPAGAKLAKSRDLEGAVRGFYHGESIAGHANFQKLNVNNLSAASNVANGVANVMNVGSLVVGQYYMNEINSKLEKISDSISKISDFQNNEFNGRIIALISGVKKISSFSTEILENDELRNVKLQSLDNYETECEKLLQQVNLKIAGLIKYKGKMSFKEYSSVVKEVSIQYYYQQALLSVLKEISQLNNLLFKGKVSLEYCYSTYHRSNNQTNVIANDLSQWHQTQLNLLDIDIQNGRIVKKGLEKIIAGRHAIFDENWRHKRIELSLKEDIESQINYQNHSIESESDVYEKDVKVIIRDGEMYYVTNE